MKYKYFLIIICLVLFSGCDITYNIEIYNDKVKEDVSFFEDNEYLLSQDIDIESNSNNQYTYGGLIELEYDSNTPALLNSANELYKKKLINDSGLGINYKYDYTLDNYSKSTALNKGYKFVKFYKENNIYNLTTSSGNLLFDENKYLDSLVIHLKTNHKVVESNADTVDGYNYYWNIDRTNYKDNKIYLKFYADKYVFNYENRFVYTVLGIVFVAILSFIVIIVLRQKSRKNNTI